MKTSLLARSAVAGVLAILFQACATTTPTSGLAALEGRWTNSLGTVWTMNADGTFDVDLDHDGKRDVWGKCTVDGNTATFAGVGSSVPDECGKSIGVYHFTRTSNMLHLTVVKDPCRERVKHVTLDWTRK